MPAYQKPAYNRSFSKYYFATSRSDANGLLMDVPLPQGAVSFDQKLNDSGSGTTNATAGTTTQITHNLGVVPNFITLTPTANGAVYLDTANAATSTTFNVLGSAASLTFDWKVE